MSPFSSDSDKAIMTMQVNQPGLSLSGEIPGQAGVQRPGGGEGLP
jgi:hypothetical protein